METPRTVNALAADALPHFTKGERVSEYTGRRIVKVADGAPDWITELCREAHGDMFPDDWRYEMIEDALRMFAEADDENGAERLMDEAEPPIYNVQRLHWLASHLGRAGYVDEACEDLCVGADVGILDRIALGYMAELREVFSSVAASLRERVDECGEEAAS